MFDMLKIRINQGSQAIKDVRKAVIPLPFRGFPMISPQECKGDNKACNACLEGCPTNAIHINQETRKLSIDIGKCVFCGDCVRNCKENKIAFSNFHKIAATNPNTLVLEAGMTPEDFYSNAIKARDQIKKIFGRSLKLRQVSAAGCNGCEMELNACSNVNFDMQRFGIEFVASPRHADGIVITGPISQNMSFAVEDTFNAVPQPRIVILVGSCAISGGVFASSPALNREFLEKYPVDLYIPGCPTHPLTFINGVLDFLGQ